jgi:quercetin dioxygenase-like cupin family protein
MISLTEKGEEFTVNAGDVVVRKGNMHGWRNPGPEWARWVAVILDAQPAIRNGKSLTEGLKEAVEGMETNET